MIDGWRLDELSDIPHSSRGGMCSCTCWHWFQVSGPDQGPDVEIILLPPTSQWHAALVSTLLAGLQVKVDCIVGLDLKES